MVAEEEVVVFVSLWCRDIILRLRRFSIFCVGSVLFWAYLRRRGSFFFFMLYVFFFLGVCYVYIVFRFVLFVVF